MLWSLATLGTAWVHSYMSFYIRHALVGVGEATFGIFAPAVLADFYPERDRNRILSIFYLAIPVGAGICRWRKDGFGLGLARTILHLRNTWIGVGGAIRLDRARTGARCKRSRESCR